MPNQWMDQILKIYNRFYDSEITENQLFFQVEKVMIEYKKEFIKYDEAITDQMVEMEGYVQD
jgi:DNA replication protein DnaC